MPQLIKQERAQKKHSLSPFDSLQLNENVKIVDRSLFLNEKLYRGSHTNVKSVRLSCIEKGDTTCNFDKKRFFWDNCDISNHSLVYV